MRVFVDIGDATHQTERPLASCRPSNAISRISWYSILRDVVPVNIYFAIFRILWRQNVRRVRRSLPASRRPGFGRGEGHRHPLPRPPALWCKYLAVNGNPGERGTEARRMGQRGSAPEDLRARAPGPDRGSRREVCRSFRGFAKTGGIGQIICPKFARTPDPAGSGP